MLARRAIPQRVQQPAPERRAGRDGRSRLGPHREGPPRLRRGRRPSSPPRWPWAEFLGIGTNISPAHFPFFLFLFSFASCGHQASFENVLSYVKGIGINLLILRMRVLL